MPKARVLKRLSAQDNYALLGDDFGWLWDIGVVATIDGSRLFDCNGWFGIEPVREWIEPELSDVPRFRQRLYRPRQGLGWPPWVDAPAFDVVDHVRAHP